MPSAEDELYITPELTPICALDATEAFNGTLVCMRRERVCFQSSRQAQCFCLSHFTILLHAPRSHLTILLHASHTTAGLTDEEKKYTHFLSIGSWAGALA